jgi:hypothetical protein
MLREALEAVAGGGCADVSTVDAQNKFDRGDSQHLDRLVCDPVQTLAMRESGQGYWMQDELAGPLRAEGENRPSRPSSVIASGLPETVGTLSDGAHQGGGLTAKMPTPGAYSPCVANPLTARMGKGINTTLDEGQTAIVCQGEEIK